MGYALAQKAVIAYDESITDGENVAQFVKVFPGHRLSQRETAELFATIFREFPEASGFTARDGALVFGNFSGIAEEMFRDKMTAALAKVGDFTAVSDRFRSDYIGEPVTLEGTRYGQGDLAGQETGRDVLRQGAGSPDSVRAEVERRLRKATGEEGASSAEEVTSPEALASRPLSSQIDNIRARYNTAENDKARSIIARDVIALPDAVGALDKIVIDGKPAFPHPYVVGTFSTIWLKSQDAYERGDHKGVKIPESIVRDIDTLLRDKLIAVYRASERNMNKGSFIAILKEFRNGLYAAVALEPNGRALNADVTFIPSVHPRAESALRTWEKEGLRVWGKPPVFAAPIAERPKVEAGPAQSAKPAQQTGVPLQESISQPRSQRKTVDEAAREAATSTDNELPQPSDAQKQAGNYAKGHVTVSGLSITIENPAGSKRRPEWPTLKWHYGYIKRTKGGDGEPVDVFVKPGLSNDYAGQVFVVDQSKSIASSKFDEHKVMLGAATAREAFDAYLDNYTKGWNGADSVTPYKDVDTFKLWLESGDTKKRAEGQSLDSRPSAPQTPEWKAWFEGSKVVDKDGAPLVMFHGTSKDIDFKSFRIGQRGTFFSADPEEASMYATDNESNDLKFDHRTGRYARVNTAPRVIPAYLSIKNPYVLDEREKVAAQFVESYKSHQRLLANRAKLKGHDGIQYGPGLFVAFDPKQVKSVFNQKPSSNSQMLRSVPRDEAGAMATMDDLDYTQSFDDFEAALERSAAGGEYSAKITWALRPRDGEWVSLTADGRYVIRLEPSTKGFWAVVDGEEISYHRTRRQAINALNVRLDKEVSTGTIKNPFEAHSVIHQFKRDAVARIVSGWRKLSEAKDIFKIEPSKKKKLAEIIADTDRDHVVMSVNISHADETGATYAIQFTSKSGDGPIVGFLNEDAMTDTAYLDISSAIKGSQIGSYIYPVVLNWAHNNNIKLIPDPAGLSAINTFRRTEQMLSAALKFGSTEFMRPHRDQGLAGWDDAPRNRAENDKNLAIMLITSMNNTFDKVPEAKKYGFDFEGMVFTRDGKTVNGKEVAALSTEEQRVKWGVGPATVARAIFTQALVENPNAVEEMLDGKLPPSLLRDRKEVAPLALYSQPDRFAPKKPGAMKGAALSVAKGALVAARPVGMALDAANAVADLAAKIPGKLIAPITSRIYDRVTMWNRDFWKGGDIRQQVAHGMISDYGLPEPYLDRRDDREIAVQKSLRQSKEMVDRIAALDHAESRVAYLWMNEKPNEAEEQRLLAMLPEGSRQALADMKQMIDRLGKEAVSLGLLSQESYERNHMAYLHRSYKKYEVQNPQSVAASQRAKAIRADTYRGRGLRDDVAPERVPGVTKGDHYVRLELRKHASAESIGQLQRVVYLPAGQPIPATYAGWRNDGVWEARYAEGNRVGMWRDLTRAERERLGEIEEVRYSFARTMIAQVHDIETAKFLAWVGREYSVADEEAVAEKGGRVADTSDSMVTLKTYADDEWVQVPGTVAQGTRLYKYGAIQSRYIPGHIWNDIRATINAQSSSSIWRLYDELLRAWKISKTALSPAVHTNNVMSNFILADIAEVSHKNLYDSLRTLIDAEQGDEAAKALLTRYLDSGAELGTPALHELRREIIEPILAKLQGEENDTLASLSVIQAVSLAARGNLRQAFAALSQKKLSQVAKAPFDTMIAAYGLEDSVFRFAKWLKETNAGKGDREAAKEARAAFLDYRINAPWIQALRRGPFPFLAFSYRVIPILAKTAAKKPWKMMKYAAAGYAVNALAYAMLGLGGDDEDKERALLPDEKRGSTILGTPRLVRMPWNDDHDSPVFLDIRRWIPGGDLIDVQGSHAAIPLPQWLSLGGFFALGMEMASNKNSFTGKELWKESDDYDEAMMKLVDHVFRFLSPNLPLPNPVGYLADALVTEKGLLQTYSWRSIQAADTGATDDFGREKSLPQAVASSAGVKLSAYPEDQLRRNLSQKRDAEIRDNSETTSRYRREHRRGSLTDEEYQARMEKQSRKAQEIKRKYSERMGLEPTQP